MCLVEVKKAAKPVISCSTKVVSGLEVFTSSTLVKHIRENIIEFLLINHPLDCPICDQGGECDLQDQTLVYGSDRGRFREYKRSVFDKNFGPFIKTVMTRCIHCTKCVRFIEEYGSGLRLGTVGRGGGTEIGSYISKSLTSELSGNIIDLCPVGALTSKPYAFKARPWELVSTESLDIFDSCGSNILVQTKGNEIMRVLPRKNDFINENWITDQIRFGYDSFKKQRLLIPYIKCTELNRIVPVSWNIVLLHIKKNIVTLSSSFLFSTSNIFVTTSNDSDLITNYISKFFCSVLNITNFNTKHNSISNNSQSSYLLSNSLSKVEYSNIFITLGLSLKTELPILNLKLKKASRRFGNKDMLFFYHIGPFNISNIEYRHLGHSKATYLLMEYGKLPVCDFLYRKDSVEILERTSTVSNSIFNFIKGTFSDIFLCIGDINSLHLNSKGNSISSLKYRQLDFPEVLYSIDGLDSEMCNFDLDNSFKIYQGSFFFEKIIGFDVFLPNRNFIEDSLDYINCEGRVQSTTKATTSPGKSVSNANTIRGMLLLFSNAINKNDRLLTLSLSPRCYKWRVPQLNVLNRLSKNFNIVEHLKTTLKYTTVKNYAITYKSFHGNNSFFLNSMSINKFKVQNSRVSNFLNI